jgi:hypothetical protein
MENGVVSYGEIAFAVPGGWSEKIPGGFVCSLTQEHGVVHLPREAMDKIKVGDLLMVLPVHSCLTVAAMGEYQTLEGERIGTMVSRLGDETEGHGGEGEQEQDDAQDADHPAVFG